MQNGILLNISNIKSGTVNNAIIQLGDIDDSGKGRHFKSRFIKDGLVKIENHGIVLLRKETIDKSLPSMIGTPVIIGHQDVTDKNVDKIRKGTISNAYFNEPDGWYYCEGIITDKEAEKLIENGWSVSCSYDFLSYDDEGGVENNIPYDKEFTNLNFTHLAIVDNPRYERANIVFNCKVNNLRDSELPSDKDKWITINGNHTFIPDGKTLDEVIEEKGWKDKKQAIDESIELEIADKPTKEVLEVIDKERERTQKTAEKQKKEYEKSKDIEIKVNNSKEQDMAILEELKKLITKVENNKENEEMIENEKVDKRKLINEVGGILKGKVDDEIIRTIIKKMEEASYDESEAGTADNKKVKNEEDAKDDKKEDKKVENEEDKEEVKEIKEEVKKDVDNKCKNSKEDSTSFDKINAIYNSVKQIAEEKTYISRQEKLDNAVEYFK